MEVFPGKRDGSDPEVEILNADDLKEIVKGMKKS